MFMISFEEKTHHCHYCYRYYQNYLNRTFSSSSYSSSSFSSYFSYSSLGKTVFKSMSKWYKMNFHHKGRKARNQKVNVAFDSNYPRIAQYINVELAKNTVLFFFFSVKRFIGSSCLPFCFKSALRS